jgi:hypothetical protein
LTSATLAVTAGYSYRGGMAGETTHDPWHPCLACGSPWEMTEVTERVYDGGPEAVLVSSTQGQCSAHCWDHDREAYARGLAARRGRGW